jgi:hypothetical protein
VAKLRHGSINYWSTVVATDNLRLDVWHNIALESVHLTDRRSSMEDFVRFVMIQNRVITYVVRTHTHTPQVSSGYNPILAR